MVDIGREALRQHQDLTHIIESSTLIGGIYNMDYEECTILSNDEWKRDAGGVPQHSYLLATSADWERKGEFDEDEAYAVLLRAQGPAELTNEQELLEIRQEAMKEMIIRDETDDEGGPVIGSAEQFIDILTQNRIQYSGINAKILGTFYQEDGELTFGSDIDTFHSSARYAVYNPHGEALSRIASYPMNPQDGEGVPIGNVQFSSTQRTPGGGDARVHVDVNDFIGHKTAVFGMTRTGKSNTLKILATAVYEHSQNEDKGVGQLLFDPNGEYANPNQQDDMALAELGSDAVTVYRLGEVRNEPGVEPLQIDFFDSDHIDAVVSQVEQELAHKRGTDYIDAFLNVDFIGPSKDASYGGWVRAQRRRTALHATLARAGLEVPDDYQEYIGVKQEVYDIVDAETDATLPKSNDVKLTKDNLQEFWEATARSQDDINDVDENWIGEDLKDILNLLEPGPTRSGYTLLKGADRYHNAEATGDYVEKVYEDLCDGKIAIIDMSLGLEEVVRDVSDRIVRHVMGRSVERFRQDHDLPNIQIYLEEAHRLFDRESYEEGNDPYVRLAKEGAKFKLGLIYATQEVTGVDRRVLANTANWVVTHLNNKNETSRLSDYYNFEDFKQPIREIDDKGFARLKMKEGEYIVPLKIDLFDAARMEQAKAAGRTRSDREVEVESEPEPSADAAVEPKTEPGEAEPEPTSESEAESEASTPEAEGLGAFSSEGGE